MALSFFDPAAIGLTWQVLAIVCLGAFIGALAAGGAGFAFGTMASAIWLHVLSPVQTTFLVVACGSLLHALLIWPIRQTLKLSRLWPYLCGGAIGIPLGVFLLTRSNAGVLKIGLGIFLICYGLYALAGPRLPQIRAAGRLADSAIGFVGGIMGGLGGYSGIAPTIWTQMRALAKDDARAIYQPFILLAHITTLLFVGALAIDRQGLVLLVATLPALLAGAFAGWQIYGRLDEAGFRKLLALLLLISGVTLVL